MSENHTSTYNMIVIKYTDNLYVRSATTGGVSFVADRNMALEFLETDKEYIKDHLEKIIKLGFNKDNIFVVEESEMVVKKSTEKTVDSFISEPEPKIDLANVSQDVWDKM